MAICKHVALNWFLHRVKLYVISFVFAQKLRYLEAFEQGHMYLYIVLGSKNHNVWCFSSFAFVFVQRSTAYVT